MSSSDFIFASIDDVLTRLAATGYVADRPLAVTLYLADRLGKPILAEGPAGVGKTELAKTLAIVADAELFRLQCYEGLDEAKTLYEWEYPKQLLYTQILRDHLGALLGGVTDLSVAVERLAAHEDAFFSDHFLQPRALLQAIRSERRVVLLIDEVDRAEDELEAFFLEVLGEMQVTVPELGTLRARHRPLVVLTSNATRELSDALRRRCLYLPLAFPSREREAEILAIRVPELAPALAAELAAFVAELRRLDLKKLPSISETIDWARALVLLGASSLGPAEVDRTLHLLLKYEGDLDLARAETATLLQKRVV
ncbi:MAG TPA: MoxR family ATPase [Kofleriaceae bacterium]|nr:MoxR family ATPase [Kofleriaceae bacterium]